MARMILAPSLTVALLLAGSPASAGMFGLGGKAEPPPVAAAASEDLVRQARRAIDEQRYSDAGQMLDSAFSAGISDPRLILLAGDLYLARGSNQQALESFSAVQDTPAVRGEAMTGRGIALSRLGRPTEAIGVLRQATALDPSRWRAWNALGVEYDRQKNWPQAEAAYAQALKAGAKGPVVYNNRGYSRLLQGRADEASADFIAALERDPAFAVARTNLRLALAARGEYARATAASGAEDQAAVYNNAGFAALMRGDLPQADALLSQAIAVRGKFYGRAQENLQLTRAMLEKSASASLRP